MIEGVMTRKLVTHADERGFFREIIRKSEDFFEEGFGQLSCSYMHAGVIKAWHIHKVQVDWWYVAMGVLKVVLHDMRQGSRSYRQTMELLMGDHRPPVILKIPPGVAHGCKVLDGPVSLFYITSEEYDPEDEGRIRHDDPEIGYDWLKGTVIT